MHFLKKIFTTATGYWIHKMTTLPIGADLFIDIHNRMKYPAIKTIFDVGANSGQTLQWFRANEQAATIYCFEPIAESFMKLQSKSKLDKNCIVEKIALGEIEGEKKIKLFEGSQSVLNSLKDELMNDQFNAKEETIKVETLDSYCLKNGINKIDLLKIDTEGYEINVLEGAKLMLQSAGIDFIYCEIGFLKENNRNTNFSDLTEWLSTKGYFFNGMYQLASNGGKIEFGNALYVQKDLLNYNNSY